MDMKLIVSCMVFIFRNTIQLDFRVHLQKIRSRMPADGDGDGC
jgi:hypothetical protein